MDSDALRLACSLGPGRVMLSGVAGSSKTMALGARARYLRERHPSWRILVVCFNGSLARHLRRTLPADWQMDVATFHDWALGQLEATGLVIPAPPGRGTQWDRYWTQDMARLLLRAFDEARVPAGTYQAILIDEGQDFVADWYRALLRALDPVAGEMLVALDPAQNILNVQKFVEVSDVTRIVPTPEGASAGRRVLRLQVIAAVEPEPTGRVDRSMYND